MTGLAEVFRPEGGVETGRAGCSAAAGCGVEVVAAEARAAGRCGVVEAGRAAGRAGEARRGARVCVEGGRAGDIAVAGQVGRIRDGEPGLDRRTRTAEAVVVARGVLAGRARGVAEEALEGHVVGRRVVGGVAGVLAGPGERHVREVAGRDGEGLQEQVEPRLAGRAGARVVRRGAAQAVRVAGVAGVGHRVLEVDNRAAL